jgi:hypothetical protein
MNHAIQQPLRTFFRRARRTGSVYVLVLGAGTLLAVVGVSLLAITQISVRTAGADDDVAEASVLAESAVEYALAKMNADSNWRTTYSSNVEVTPRNFGRGKISFRMVDEADGNLSNNTTDSIRLYGIGRAGKATRVYSILCSSRALTSLATGMSFGSSLTFDISTRISSYSTVTTRGLITSTAATLGSTNLEAGGLVTVLLGSGTGTRKSLQPLREMPSKTDVFAYYSANGTKISGLPVSGGNLVISRVLISPGSNPFTGGTNANGVYYIDCAGQNLVVKDCRIIGTIAFINSNNVTIEGSVNWEPAVLGYPIILIDKAMKLETSSPALAENGSPAVNFNPAGAGYPFNAGGTAGPTDTDNTDSYPSQLKGLIFVAKGFSTSNSPSLTGCLIGLEDWDAKGTMSLTYGDASYVYPPPGFRGSSLAPVPGSWRRESSP